MKKKNAVAPMYRPAQTHAPNPETIAIPQRSDATRTRVFQANNADSDWRNGLLGALVFAGASVALGFAFESVTVGAIAYTIFATITVMAVTGVLSTVFALFLEGISERKEIRVERDRVEAHRQIITRAQRIEIERNQQEHDLGVARLEADKAIQVAQLTDSHAHNPDNFVPAIPNPADRAIRNFLRTCYTPEGFNIPDVINGPAGGLVRSPWNHAWKGESWRMDAKTLMVQYVLDPADKNDPPRQWKLRYKTRREADDALPRHGG